MGQLTSPRWTPAQETAITDRGGALLLSAAAGSGKTAVLTERAVGLMCQENDPVPAEQLLIVTFTNAAAAELRARLAKKLNARLAQTPAGSPQLHWMRRQQMMLGRADICTIDAFCIKLLRQQFRALDIPPDFTTGDEGGLLTLREQAMADTLEAAYWQKNFCRFADLLGRSRSDQEAAEAIGRMYDFLRTLPDYPAQLEAYCAAWENDAPLEQTEVCRAQARWAARELRQADESLAYAQTLCGQAEQEDFDAVQKAYGPPLTQERGALANVIALFEALRWDEALAALDGWKKARVSFARAKTPEEKNAEPGTAFYWKKRVVTARDAAAQMVKDLQGSGLPTRQEYEEDRQTAAPLVRALADAVTDFDRRFWEARREHKLLDFADLEHLALKLLWDGNGPTPLAAQIAGGYRAVMVDEYQDTNRLQDTLYHCLAGDGSKLFLVGDLKQSIYRFRQADPTVFQEKKQEYALYQNPAPGVPAPAYPAQLALDNNFRSAKGVIAAINGIFGAVMTPAAGGVDYANTPGEALALPPQPEAYPGGCELCLVSSPEKEDAGYIARRIREMLDKGFPVRDGAGGTRPCRPEDFAILLRSWTNADNYLQALEGEGLQGYSAAREDLLDSPAVRPLLSLLHVLDNPAQDVALASVLLSPLVGLTMGELTELRAARPHGTLYRAVLPRPEQSGKSQGEQKAEGFYASLSELRNLARTLPVDRLLDEVLARTGYLALAGAMPGGEVRRREVQDFLNLACGLGEQGLAALVRSLDALAKRGQVNSAKGDPVRPGCVSVMTIHGSKGLEFPVVFCARLSKQFNTQDLNHAVLFHPKNGVGLKLRGPGGTYATLAYEQVRRAAREEGLGEEMRVLYVALTRAKDRLILTLPVTEEPLPAGNGPDTKSKGWEKLVDNAVHVRMGNRLPLSPGEWVLAAAMGHKSSEPLWSQVDLCPQDAGLTLTDAWPLELRTEKAPPARTAEVQKEAEAAADPELARQLAEGFAWRYPHENRTRLAAKVSVTGLVHRDEEVQMERPAFLQKDGMTGAEKGTVTHAFLQHADLELAGRDLEAEARRQEQLGLIARENVEKLDRPALKRFFAGELFRRIGKAKQALREYAFISAVPAAALAETDEEKAGLDPKADTVLIQGVADLVLVFEDHVEIVDYKTDHNKTADELLRAYAAQLRLYARAIGLRLAPTPVTRCTLYSFALGREVDVPLRGM